MKLGPSTGCPTIPIEYVLAETPVPLGWMRSVYALQAAFALESFHRRTRGRRGKRSAGSTGCICWRKIRTAIFHDDLADRPHARRAATCRGESGWDKPLPRGRYRGIACFGCFASYMAEVVEISMENDAPRVHRVVAAVDCGQVMNPSILEQQIQGGIVYGLAMRCAAKITIEKGRVVQGNFDDYAPLRMEETPVVEVYAVPSTEAPTGIGEPSVPPIAPALCNAIYAATKKRIRALPILSWTKLKFAHQNALSSRAACYARIRMGRASQCIVP